MEFRPTSDFVTRPAIGDCFFVGALHNNQTFTHTACGNVEHATSHIMRSVSFVLRPAWLSLLFGELYFEVWYGFLRHSSTMECCTW